MTSRRLAPLAPALVVLAALTACGDGTGAAGASTSTSSGSSSATSSESSAPSSGSDTSGSDGSGTSQASCPPEGGASERVTSFDDPPPMCIDPTKKYTATMRTDAGDITLALDATKAPATVNNFVVLARHKFYDGITFHRVIPDFMIQGGDPDGTGAGGPGYVFPDELPQAGDYAIGSLAMANAGPNTNGSQFFIVTGEAGEALPPSYSLFGKVTKGMDVVQTIEADGSAGGQPQTTHTIESVTVTEK